ncbi:AI-2E family transporter [Virgibacillus xinjiangensis]|uniref:AI-2E family transporter n=1 Tax=Virgibacillus xinjiangensis TaxID=393090 RepID=A0ABV7CTU8_9BACI
MMLLHKKWFHVMTFLIMLFLLIWLVSITDFIFMPVVQLIGAVAFPVLGAGLLFYLTKPIMHLFERFNINRIVSIILVYLLIILLVTLFILYIWPIAQRQVTNLLEAIPGMVRSVEEFIDYWQDNYSLLPAPVLDAINDFTAKLPTIIENSLNNLVSMIGGFLGQLFTIIAGLVLIPFFLFFMLKDEEKLVPFITQIFSPKKAKNLRSLLGKVDHVLSAFIQGQLIVSFFVGVMLFIGYLIIGLDYALTLSLFGMMTNVIPFIGPYIAVVPALIVGAIQDPMNLIWVSIIMLVAQQIESNLISPNVMGQALHLHPLTIITVILAAGSIAGFIGIVFAVPFYAVAKTIIVHFYQTYADSRKDEKDALI